MLGVALASAGLGMTRDLMNFGLQKRYQDRMTEKVWEREDSAVQRRVADLRKAGLSPTLAAGSAAAAGPPVQAGGAAQLGDSAESLQDAVRGAVEMKAAHKGLRKLDAEIGQTEADARRANAEATLAEARAKFAEAAGEDWYIKGASEREIAGHREFQERLKSDLVRKFGMRDAEAGTKARELALRISETQEKMGAGAAGGVNQWLPLLRAMLDVMGN